MIVLDTNVVSELTLRAPSAAVAAWVDSVPMREVFLTAITQAEMLFGATVMPEGRRKPEKSTAVMRLIEDTFARHILPFDSAAATHFAEIAGVRRRTGRPIEVFDAQIAAITRSRGMSLATRNIRDFADCGLDIINPWTYSP